jgi:DNA-binding NarL/FixJ family response regulator
MDQTRIAIVEDDPATRGRFAALFDAQDDFALVGAVGDGAAGRALIARERLDVLLVDLGLPDVHGIELIGLCARLQPDCDPVVVTVLGSGVQVVACLEAGATGYLLKDDLPGEIVECVRLLRRGGSPVSPGIARKLLERFRLAPARTAPSVVAQSLAAARVEPLSARELEILELVSKGLSGGEIGSLLGLSTHTVGTHIKHVYRKLAVHSRVEAVYEARHLGLLRD